MIRRARRDGREERGLRKGAIVSLSPQGMTSWSSSIKVWFFQAIECIIKKKICHGVKQYATRRSVEHWTRALTALGKVN